MLAGERIFLRPLERSDLSQVAIWRNDTNIRSCFFSPYLIVTSSQDKWFDDYSSQGESLIFIICELNTNERLGMVGLDHIDHRNQNAEYGRMLIGEKNKRGHGYAQEATLAIVKYAFMNLNMHRIYLRVYADNVKALQLYERCNFVKEGVERDAIFMDGRFRDVVIMSILRDEMRWAK